MGLGVLPTPIALLFAIHLFSFRSQLCTATDTLDSTHPIKDGRTLVSAHETFELGFFSVGNSRLRYVGIWYKKIPLRKYVWVANRENPLRDSSGTLTIGSRGNLVILDRNQEVVWRTNVSARWNSSTAVLLDTGNLQLTEGGNANSGGTILWESFQQPSNTFLQNMQIGKNTKTGESRFITSWKSDDDPAPGNFSFGLNPGDLRQVFIWNGTKPHWRSGHWNGRSFIGVPDMEDDSVYLNGVSLFTDTVEGTVYFQFALYDPSMVTFFELSSSGMLQKLDWDGDQQRWVTEWRGPHPNGCDAYNFCGPFARCKGLESPVCGCLKGFVPRDADGWGRGDHSGGCVRRTELGCEKKGRGEEQDRFWKMEKIKLPDFAMWVAGLNATECAVECLNNCSCVAHSHVDGIGCFHWGGQMVDIEEFSDGGEDLHFRLVHSEFEKSRKMHIFVAIMVVLFGLLIIIMTGSCILVISGSKRKGRKIGRFFNSATNNAFKQHLANGNLFRESVMKEGAELPLFSLNGIEVATNYFSEANKIGAGGFGPVYKGRLSGGQEIAVKRLSKSSGQGMEEFKNEAIFISRLQHRNLVRLLGCCIEGEEKMLIYEYMPNKSLDSFLFDANRRAQLDWSKRFHIVEGIARGLLYLHRDSRLRIIHRDLKASNILLDEEMTPKISDFGMAWSFGGSQTLTETNKVVGTYGYMAPEYEKEGQFSEKSDVFSFGVLLIEIVSGKKNSCFYHEELSLNLLRYAWLLWNESRLTDLVDPALGDSYSPSEVSRCIHVGLLCVQEMASDRPKISTIVFMLGSEIAIRPSPAAPAASIDRDSPDSAKPFLKHGYSVNNLSITTIDGR